MDQNMTVDQLFPSRWLKSSDIGSNPRTATITKIDFEEVGQDRDRKAILSFQNTKKRMILNRTNAQILANLYGKEVQNWIGKRITLYCAEVQFRGTPCLAVRIREQVPGATKENSQSAPAPKAARPENEPSWPEEEIPF
jgi:hypothetical protein